MKIAISGTYSTGKTTTALALSYLTDIKLTSASTMRELLPQMLPGKRLDECSTDEILQLVLTRIIERCNTESGNMFIADGCAFQEFSYSIARLKYGINPNLSEIGLIYNKLTKFKSYSVFESIIKSIEDTLVNYINSTYDYVIHLPLEIPLDQDGHRPVNENFRRYSETILEDMYQRLTIPVIIVSGSIKNRIETILNRLNIETKYNIDQMIEKAKIDCNKKYNSKALEYMILK